MPFRRTRVSARERPVDRDGRRVEAGQQTGQGLAMLCRLCSSTLDTSRRTEVSPATAVNTGKRDAGRLLAVFAVTCALIAVPYAVSAEENAGQLRKLTAEWWQWAFSIPSSVNPLQDASGEHCMVGQRGDVWFLAGTITGVPATRTCAVPEVAELFLPIANSFVIAIDCDGSPTGETIQEARAGAASGLEGTQIVKVELDGQPIANVRRVRSEVFWAALPEDNIIDQFCAPTNTPTGIYSPAVDDGYYVKLKPLPVGQHTLQFETTGTVSQNITYTLNVKPVRLK